mmetsp:Transcript_34732/g.104691  ORF Transcript_34732/g.104691 Transcript_34732/m.104691 type:complete len:202 (+) Transcript_34732:164-769(+)
MQWRIADTGSIQSRAVAICRVSAPSRCAVGTVAARMHRWEARIGHRSCARHRRHGCGCGTCGWRGGGCSGWCGGGCSGWRHCWCSRCWGRTWFHRRCGGRGRRGFGCGPGSARRGRWRSRWRGRRRIGWRCCRRGGWPQCYWGCGAGLRRWGKRRRTARCIGASCSWFASQGAARHIRWCACRCAGRIWRTRRQIRRSTRG